MRCAKVVVATLLFALLAGARPAYAQSLALSLFERYLDSLREQAAIPGMSVAVIQNGSSPWVRGLGKQDVEAGTPATPDTPYNIGGLSQTLGAAMLLRTCLEERTLELNDRVVRWVPEHPNGSTTVAQLLTHTSDTGQFVYDLDRFAALTGVIVACSGIPYDQHLTDTLIEPLGMASTAPGADFDAAAPRPGLSEAARARFASVVRRAAASYRVDRGRVVRTDPPPARLSAAGGVLSSVTDLARFNRALETGTLLTAADVAASWTQALAADGTPMRTGLGWFVQNHNGEPLVWQFGQVKDGHSALILNLPARALTFIALANSDGLTGPYNLQNGDVKASPFAALFLRFFVP